MLKDISWGDIDEILSLLPKLPKVKEQHSTSADTGALLLLNAEISVKQAYGKDCGENGDTLRMAMLSLYVNHLHDDDKVIDACVQFTKIVLMKARNNPTELRDKFWRVLYEVSYYIHGLLMSLTAMNEADDEALERLSQNSGYVDSLLYMANKIEHNLHKDALALKDVMGALALNNREIEALVRVSALDLECAYNISDTYVKAADSIAVMAGTLMRAIKKYNLREIKPVAIPQTVLTILDEFNEWEPKTSFTAEESDFEKKISLKFSKTLSDGGVMQCIEKYRKMHTI